MKPHRYEQIAHALSQRITTGRLAVGDHLPTEADLCKRYRVSRYTAREALRVLREAGLVTRRRRAGTIVTAAQSRGAFQLPIGSATELFRYAKGIRLEIEQRATQRCTAQMQTLLGGGRGHPWFVLEGIRRQHARAKPACVITVYLHAVLADVYAHIPTVGAVIYPMIEKTLGVGIVWIRQRIEAIELNERDAQRLNVASGSYGLRVLRFYYDANERLLQCSDSRHAGHAFAYEMRLQRE
jgi:DNA-binding GntR family transcriptional regulator